MRRLIVFNNVSLDGYFSDSKGDVSWARHESQDEEFNAFIAENANRGGQLLFGRITYEMMASYWPTPMAAKKDPMVAQGINHCPKAVFSRTLEGATWNNTKLVKGDLIAEVRKMKQEPGADMAILGSRSLVSQLAPEGLIDEYQLMVNPIILGRGLPLFDVKKKLALKLSKTRAFGNGNVLLCYEPAA